jgi:hypothetical protein
MKAVLVVVALAGTATAAPIAVTELPSKPTPIVKATQFPAGITLEPGENSTLELKGGCAIQDVPDDWIEGVPPKQRGFRTSHLWESNSSLAVGVERIVDDKLEHYAVTIFHGGGYEVFAKTVLPLKAVAQHDGVTVYGYRRGNQVMLFAPTKEGASVRYGRAKSSGATFDFDQCPVAMTVLQLDHGSSEPAMIFGTAPDGRAYRVDASLVKTARDPVAVLSVVIR